MMRTACCRIWRPEHDLRRDRGSWTCKHGYGCNPTRRRTLAFGVILLPFPYHRLLRGPAMNLAALALLILGAPGAAAFTSVPYPWNYGSGDEASLVLTFPEEVAQAGFTISASFTSGPATTWTSLGGTVAVTWTASATGASGSGGFGCSVSTPTTSMTSTSAGISASMHATGTMTGGATECWGNVRFQFSVGSTTMDDRTVGWHTRTRSNAAITGSMDTQSRLCAASPLGTACSQPTSATVVTGSLDTQSRQCAASSLGAACSTPTVNTPLSGTVGLSGTVNTVNSGTLAVSGTLDTQSRFCAASSFGAACTTPLVNADTQARLCNASTLGSGCINPQLAVRECGSTSTLFTGSTVPTCQVPGHNQAITGTLGLSGSISATLGGTIGANLSGTVLGCGTAAFAADPLACTRHTNTTFAVGSVNATIPGTFRVDGSDGSLRVLREALPLLLAAVLTWFAFRGKDPIPYLLASAVALVAAFGSTSLSVPVRIIVGIWGVFLAYRFRKVPP